MSVTLSMMITDDDGGDLNDQSTGPGLRVRQSAPDTDTTHSAQGVSQYSPLSLSIQCTTLLLCINYVRLTCE